MFATVYGHDHPAVASSKRDMGLAYKQMGKLSEAKQMFTEAADIRRKVFSADHQLTKQTQRLTSTSHSDVD